MDVSSAAAAGLICALTFFFPAQIHGRDLKPTESPLDNNKPTLNSADKHASCHFPIVKRFGGVLLGPRSADLPAPGIIYPEVGGGGGNAIQIAPSTQIQLLCPGQGNGVVADASDDRTSTNRSPQVTISCTGDDVILVGNKTYDARDMRCKKPSRSTAKLSGQTCSGPDVSEILIGFPVGSDGFVTTITACFHEERKAALRSKYSIQAAILSAAKGVRRPNFEAAHFYAGINVNAIYKQRTQLQTLSRILNSTELAEKYIVPDSRSGKFMTRGHLAAKADFIYAAEQKATFYYVNAAPQWASFNKGNWNSLEDNLRTLVHKLGRSVDVYVGTYGVTTLPDVNNKEQELYLYFHDNDNKAVPVPKLFWKMVYEPVTRRGVVVLGVNNPHLTPVPDDYILCTSVCAQIRWIQFNVNNERQGYTYCCTVDDFKKAVNTFVPDIVVDSLLT